MHHEPVLCSAAVEIHPDDHSAGIDTECDRTVPARKIDCAVGPVIENEAVAQSSHAIAAYDGARRADAASSGEPGAGIGQGREQALLQLEAVEPFLASHDLPRVTNAYQQRVGSVRMVDDRVLAVLQRESMLRSCGINKPATDNAGIIDAKHNGPQHGTRCIDTCVFAFAQHKPVPQPSGIVVAAGDVSLGVDPSSLGIDGAWIVDGAHLPIEVRECVIYPGNGVLADRLTLGVYPDHPGGLGTGIIDAGEVGRCGKDWRQQKREQSEKILGAVHIFSLSGPARDPRDSSYCSSPGDMNRPAHDTAIDRAR